VSLSVTVAVQVVGLPIDTEPGTHETIVCVDRVVTVTCVLAWLVECVLSPV
jgi:hypothetical protein